MAYLETAGDAPVFDIEACNSKGKALAGQYQKAHPFPHIVIDDFLPSHLLDECSANFPTELSTEDREFCAAKEMFKRNYNPDYLAHPIRQFFYSLNARPFLGFLESLTGIEGLIPDPYFTGGGFHETLNGGYLAVHTDFNHHQKLNLERRINLLIYLNKGWQEDYGGALELWSAGMRRAEVKVVPTFNRAVIFNTTGKSFHGHPGPNRHPYGLPRRSIALYYYTATWQTGRRAYSTRFRNRKGVDHTPRNEKISSILATITPRWLSRNIKKIRRKITNKL